MVEKEKNFLIENQINNPKIFVINGSPQIDYMMKQKFPLLKQKLFKIMKINQEKKTILFLQNSSGVRNISDEMYKNKLDICEYYKILKIMINFAEKNNYHIFSKLKSKNISIKKNLNDGKIKNMLKEVHLNPNVTVIDPSSNILSYDLFFSDIMVIQSHGTSLIESMIINPKTIQCQLSLHHDFSGIKKYNLLPQANSENELIYWLDVLSKDPNSKITKPFQKQRKQFIQDFYGKVENSTDKIQKILFEI